MSRNKYRIGKAEKRHKRNRQDHWYRKYGYPSERREGCEPYDPGVDANLMLATAVTLLMACKKGGRKGRNEKEARQSREEEEAGKEAARVL